MCVYILCTWSINMKLELYKNQIVVTRTDSHKIYKDSTLMIHVKRELQKLNYDVITKDLSKEPGNLLSTPCYGIIDRNRNYQIYYANYCIDDAYQHYNNGSVTLSISGDM